MPPINNPSPYVLRNCTSTAFTPISIELTHRCAEASVARVGLIARGVSNATDRRLGRPGQRPINLRVATSHSWIVGFWLSKTRVLPSGTNALLPLPARFSYYLRSSTRHQPQASVRWCRSIEARSVARRSDRPLWPPVLAVARSLQPLHKFSPARGHVLNGSNPSSRLKAAWCWSIRCP